MSKTKKIILIVVSVIVILAIIGLLLYFTVFTNKEEKNQTENIEIVQEEGASKLNSLYSALEQRKSFSYKSRTLDDKNEFYYAKKDDMAYTDSKSEDIESKYIIKDGNSYLLLDEQKMYYEYKNNEIDLNKITENLEQIKDGEYTEGTEEIEGKNYSYEEYEGITELLLGDFDELNGKTRFYFDDNNNLKYIKTIFDDKQELLEVEISINTNDAIFDIPSGYNKGN